MVIYKISYREKEISGNKYLLINQGEELEIFQYVKIISNSDICYALNFMIFKHKVEDTDIIYNYSVGDRASLQDIAESKGVNKNVFVSAILTLANSLARVSKFNLAQESVIIDKRFIYVGEVDTLLVYLPFEITVDVKAEFRRLMDYISDKLTDCQEEFDRVSAIIKSEYTFDDIYKCLSDSDIGALEEEDISYEIPENSGFSWGGNSSPEDEDVDGLRDSDQGVSEENEKAAGLFGLFKKKETADKKFKPEKPMKPEKPQKPEKPARITKPPKIKQSPSTSAFAKKKEGQNLDKLLRNQPDNHGYTELNDGLTDLADPDEVLAVAYLLCKMPADEKESDKVMIGDYPFSIGRGYPTSVSPSGILIARKYVSLHHAVLSREGNDFYITDTGTQGKGSTGGTFVNDIQIKPNIRKQISDGDILKFYRLEYVFNVE